MSYKIIETEKDAFEKSLEQLSSLILLYFGTTKYENDWLSNMHSHDYLEIFIVLKGSGKLIIENIEYTLKKNNIVFINSGVMHTEVSDSSESLEYLFFAVDNIKLKSLSANQLFSSELCPVYSYDNTPLQTPVNEIIKWTNSNSVSAPVVIKNYLIILLVLFLQSIYDTEMVPTQSSAFQYEVAKEYINKHFASRITLDELAANCYVSKWHLTRLFKQHSGSSPFEYINAKRLELAKKLLRETDYSITKIAYESGFNSSSYFSQIFKKAFNTSPENYRKIKEQVIK